MNAMIYRAREYFGRETFGLLILMAIMVTGFSIAAPQFLTAGSLSSIGVQAPLLGILTLAMLAPMISGGFNLAIIYTANISGLTLAWVLLKLGGPDAGIFAIILGSLAALVVGTLVSILQAVTQVHEATLAFVPKLLAAVAVFAIAGPWMLNLLLDYMRNLFTNLPYIIG